MIRNLLKRIAGVLMAIIMFYLLYMFMMITICGIDPSCHVSLIRDRHVTGTTGPSVR